MSRHKIVVLYALTFVFLTLGDLGSTLLGQQVGAREFNPAMAAGLRIAVGRFLVVNAVLGILLVVMLGWALKRTTRVEPSYLARPWQGALSWMTYVNPFSARNQPRAVFHWTAIALSLLLVRAVVVANNFAIARQLPDLLTPLARIVGTQFEGSLHYVITATILIAPLWLASLYATRSLLIFVAQQRTGGEPALRKEAT